MDLSNITLLLVEDDDSVRELMLGILKRYAFKDIYCAIDGQDGLENYKYYLPDIVITDYSMPIANGLDMSKRIKEHNPDIPIILVTAMSDKDTIIEAINVGLDGYLFKPLNMDKLSFLIEKHAKKVLLQKNFQKEQNLLHEYKRAIDVSSAVTKTDRAGVITYTNDSFCEMSGYTREELIGKKHNIVKHPDTPRYIYLDMWKTITNKKVWQGRIQNLNKDKTTYYEYSVIVPILNEKGNIEEYICLRQDITDLYNQREHLRKRIEKEVNINIELHKKRSEENLKEAKFSTIGRMAAGITHEINTPLTYTKGNLELMVQDISNLDDGIKEKKYLLEDSETVINGINRIAYIVESMREVASQKKVEAELKSIYYSLITALTLSHNKAKFISNIIIQDELFVLGMDKDKYNFDAYIQLQRIEQVFVIIINNALDALAHIDDFDKRLLEISIKEKDGFIVVKFQDNAGGISEDMMPKLFDPFESSKEEGGMGIGLNVAKKIIDDHNGQIIPSNSNDGAVFKVYIPNK